MKVSKEVPDYVYECDGKHLDQLLVTLRKKEIEFHVDGTGNTWTLNKEEVKKWVNL